MLQTHCGPDVSVPAVLGTPPSYPNLLIPPDLLPYLHSHSLTYLFLALVFLILASFCTAVSSRNITCSCSFLASAATSLPELPKGVPTRYTKLWITKQLSARVVVLVVVVLFFAFVKGELSKRALGLRNSWPVPARLWSRVHLSGHVDPIIDL